MKIPDKIKILGQEMAVELTHPRQIGIKDDYDERYNLIRIRHDKDIPLSQKEDTLLHEILEAIADLTCISIDHTTLSVIATVLHQVLRDNDLDFRNESLFSDIVKYERMLDNRVMDDSLTEAKGVMQEIRENIRKGKE